jgi:hypothetical protein
VRRGKGGPNLKVSDAMTTVTIKVTRCFGAALSDSDEGGWQVSYVKRQFQTRAEAEVEADRLRTQPTPSEARAISEGQFVDEEVTKMDGTRKITESGGSDALTPDKRIPDALQRELTTMRRNPDGFKVTRMVKCGLGCGKGQAYSLTHADSETAGSWCPRHGWLFFDSVALPPTERLTPSEIEDRRLAQQRQEAVKRRNLSSRSSPT